MAGLRTNRRARGTASAIVTWVLLAAALLMMFTINVLDLPGTMPYIEHTVPGAKLPDMQLGYGPEAFYRMLDPMQAEGRQLYMRFLLTFDAVFPALYAAALFRVVRLLLRRALPAVRHAAGWGWLAAAAGVCDYSENVCALLALHRYPAELSGLAQLAGIFTFGKWLSLALTLLAIVAALAVLLFRRLSRGKGRAKLPA